MNWGRKGGGGRKEEGRGGIGLHLMERRKMVCEGRPDGDGDGLGRGRVGNGLGLGKRKRGSRRQWVGGSKRPSSLRLGEKGPLRNFDNGRASSVAAILGPFLCWPAVGLGRSGMAAFCFEGWKLDSLVAGE